jgi:predicted secreted Zn-dependent protease
LLEWNEYYTLTWEDFQGQATEGSMGDAGTAVQIKATPYYVKDKVRYNVFAYFDRSKSWSRDQSTLLLAHEQLHFEIAELYARKIRQKIADLEKKGVNDVKTYNAAINAILNESNEVDQRYDVETLHGAMQKKQAQWQKTVKQELQSLKFYKKPKNVISVGKRLSSQPLIFG